MKTSKNSSSQPLAIVGIGCRFPGGVCNPEDYWDLIYHARDGIVEVPQDRWNVRRFYDPDPEAPGKVYVRAGGFLQQRIDQFDATFFGITPREAACIDPQQRLLLEVAWETMEDSGVNPRELAGEQVGVYVGAFTLDNNVTQMSAANRAIIGAHSAVGSTMTILSNRISYVFDLRGPSISLDTACSSSMVAFHLACQDLWRGTCSMALAAGVNVMFAPEYTIAMCKGHFLSPDGRCKSFDDRANGYGRGEGAGMVVLKPLAAAIANGDRIYAVVRATGCNQDGRTSGITVPNPEAQATLLRRVCFEAGVPAQQVIYVEAHGTGTAVGDPAEASALGAVIGAGRSNGNSCAIGSVKANIGHLEAASGIAGVIKAALCLNHRTIPPLARLETPNRAIPFAQLGLRLPVAPEPMREGTAHVVVNSFGYGGTNACTLLSSASPSDAQAGTDETDAGVHGLGYFLPISARSEAGVRKLAEGYAKVLTGARAPRPADICYSAGARRGHHDARFATWSNSAEGLRDQLVSYLCGEPPTGYVSGTAVVDCDCPVFVFTGMGPQWWGMGQELYKVSPVFRDTVDRCDAVYRKVAGWSIWEEMMLDQERSRMRKTEIAQPANFVLQAALAALLRSTGIEPAAVVGHSVGEISAAYVGGALDLESALLVSYHRSRVQAKAAGLGSMLAVGIPSEEALELIATHERGSGGKAKISIAAANSPSSVTLSGETAVLQEIASQLEAQGVFHRFLQVEVPYHSPLMDPLRGELLASLGGLHPSAPILPTYSTVTGERVEGVAFDADYWWANVRQGVRFVTAMRNLITAGNRVFLEVGPHPVLSTSIKECLTEARCAGTTFGTLRRGEPERDNFQKAIGGLYTSGARIDWRKLYPRDASFVSLPHYPWQRETYWHETPAAQRDRVGEPEHALLGDRVAGPQMAWQAVLQRGLVPYLDDHYVEGLRVLPGAAYVELGLAMQKALGGDGPYVLEDLQFQQALVIDDGEERTLRCTLDEKTREYAVYSQGRTLSPWQMHATGRLLRSQPVKRPVVDLATLSRACAQQESADSHYEDMQRRGLQYGPYFQGVRQLFVNSARKEALARIECDALQATDTHAYHLHPALLDACFQALLSLVVTEDTYVPVRIAQIRFWEKPEGSFWCHARRHDVGNGSIEGHLTLFDNSGKALVEVSSVTAHKVADKRSQALQHVSEWLHRFEWVSQDFTVEPAKPANWIVMADEAGTGKALVPLLKSQGAKSVVTVRRGSCFTEEAPDRFRVSPENENDYDRLFDRLGREPGQRIAYLWGLDAPIYPNDEVGSADVVAAMLLLRSLTRETGHAAHVFVVTQGAQPVESGEGISLAQSPLIGLLRSVMNEHPEHRFTSVDLASNAAPDAADLARELLATDPEDEVALRRGGRYVHRLLRAPSALDDSTGLAAAVRVPASSPFQLELGQPGVVASIRLREVQRRAPAADEIEVRVEAMGLSSADVQRMSAMGHGEDKLAAKPLIDCVGIVVRAGSDVKGFKAGDRIVGSLATGANYVTFAPAVECVAHLRDWRNPAISLGILPVVYAIHALESVGLKPGQRALIHATSATGFAAVRAAQAMGADVIAAVHEEGDREMAESCGARQVISIWAADFAGDLAAINGDAGVDVVFGIEGGEILAKSYAALAPGGRYLHFHEGGDSHAVQTPMWLSSNRSFTVFARRLPLPSWPSRFRELWERVSLQADTVAGARRAVYPIDALSSALHAAEQQGERVVVTINSETEIDRLPMARPGTQLKPNAWYLITGGFGGLGLDLAKRMVRAGARHMLLVGRRGAVTPEAQEAVSTMRRLGAEVWEAAFDITDRKQVDDLFARVTQRGLPLRGVLHAAATFDDVLLRDLNRERFESVMLPKTLGAFHLHEATRGQPLDFFVLFSSTSALVGSMGQSAYAAGNVYLDAFAHWRRAQGLTATSVNWGFIGEVGISARNTVVNGYLRRVGLKPFSPSYANDILYRILDAGLTQIGVVDIDWQQWANFHPAWAVSARFQNLIATQEAKAGSAHEEFLQSVLAMDESARLSAINETIKRSVAETMMLPPDSMDDHSSLVSLGLDSLMAMELQAAIEREVGVKISTLEMLKGAPICELSQSLLKRLMDEGSERPPGAADAPLEPAVQTAQSNPLVPHPGDALRASEALESLDALSGAELDSLMRDFSQESMPSC